MKDLIPFISLSLLVSWLNSNLDRSYLSELALARAFFHLLSSITMGGQAEHKPWGLLTWGRWMLEWS